MNGDHERTIRRAVERDLEMGFERRVLTGVRFEPMPDFEGVQRVITEADTSVVVWRISGLNTVPIHNVQPAVVIDPAGGNQREPARVYVEGVTIVHHPQGTPETEWGYYRFTDWNSLAGQIGTSRGRAATQEPIRDVVRRAGRSPGGFATTESPDSS